MTPTRLTQPEALDYAEQWIMNWNRKDVEAVLSHFSDEVVFTSPQAASIMGSARLEGKTRLREYWTRAVAAIGTIHFELDYVVSEGNRIAIIYTAELGGKRIRACELLVFGPDGEVCQGEAMYGATL
jgi:ketosteroid isomerase-like protein